MPNVIAIFGGEKRELGGCEIYRTTMPFHYLAKKNQGWKASWGFYKDIWEEAHKGDPAVYWSNLGRSNDLFVFPRIFFTEQKARMGFAELVKGLHQLGKRVVYEVDDDMTNEDRKVIQGNAIETASLCDAITVTTPYLGSLMEARTGKKAYVLPNMIAPEVWFDKPRAKTWNEDKITIGLTGSHTHSRDWEVLKDVLPKVVQDDRVHLLLMGYHPDYLQNLPNTTYLNGVAYANYAHVIRNCDIILAPVNNEPFNLGKSSVKIVEGMAARRMLPDRVIAGAACLASNHPIYQDTIKDGSTGLLIDHTPTAWLDALDRVVYQDDFRKSLQINGHEWVQKNHDISKKSALWANAYKAILKKQPSN